MPYLSYLFFLGLVFSLLQSPALAAQTAAALPTELNDPLPTSPHKVLFMPTAAQLYVKEQATVTTLRSGQRGIYLALPTNFFPDSLQGSIDTAPINNFYQEPMPEPPLARTQDPAKESDPQRKALLVELAAAKDALTAIDSRILGIQSQIRMWQTTPTASMSMDERLKLNDALEQRLPAFVTALFQQQQAQQEAQRQLACINARLSAYDEVHKSLLVSLPYAGKEDTVTVAYSYLMPATAEFAYTLSADTTSSTVQIEQYAELQHSFPGTWRDTDISFSTQSPFAAIAPGNLPSWLVGFKPSKLRSKAASIMKASAEMDSVVYAEAQKAAAPAPYLEEQSVYSIWQLGTQTLAPNTPNRLLLMAESLPASIYYTLRPQHDQNAFLTADFSFGKAPLFPRGKARIMTDGVYVGQSMFSLYGKEGKIFFGADPKVQGHMKNLSAQSGEKGLFTKDMTYAWDWLITVSNQHDRDITVRVEDALPTADDSRITLKVVSQPPAEQMSIAPDTSQASTIPVDMLCWQLDIKAGGTAEISHKVTASTSEKEQLYPGRGRQ